MMLGAWPGAPRRCTTRTAGGLRPVTIDSHKPL